MDFIVKCICSLGQVSKKTSRFDITHVLSLIDPLGMRVFLHPYHKVEWKQLKFEDIKDPDDRWAPNKDHVEQIIDWAKNLPDRTNLLVHCFAGVSRSSASAITIECARNNVKTIGELDEIYKYFFEIRPVMYPNDLIIQYADEILGLDGLLIRKNFTFKKEKPINFTSIF
jgi:predicted protein tyrosine phosphatase